MRLQREGEIDQPFSLTELAGRMVRETRPGHGDGSGVEAIRQVVENGLPVEAVKALQAAWSGRPARATLQRRERLKEDEGETVLRVASILALAAYVDVVWDVRLL